MQQIAEGAALGAALQLLLGGPFLLHSAGAYLSRAFELSRCAPVPPSAHIMDLSPCARCP